MRSIFKIAAAALMTTSMLSSCAAQKSQLSLCEAGKPVAADLFTQAFKNPAVNILGLSIEDFNLENIITIDQKGPDSVLCHADATYKIPINVKVQYDYLGCGSRTAENACEIAPFIRMGGSIQYSVKNTPEGKI
jgi:hypothetical protein